MPPVATKLPPSTDIVVEERFVSDDVPVSDIVVELEDELSVGDVMVEVGLVESIKTVLLAVLTDS